MPSLLCDSKTGCRDVIKENRTSTTERLLSSVLVDTILLVNTTISSVLLCISCVHLLTCVPKRSGARGYTWIEKIVVPLPAPSVCCSQDRDEQLDVFLAVLYHGNLAETSKPRKLHPEDVAKTLRSTSKFNIPSLFFV